MIVFVGDFLNKFMDIYVIVCDVFEVGVVVVEFGVIVELVDVVVCVVIENVGYSEVFIYCIGYGFGFEVYELLYIVDGNDCKFELGMVFSIEFGVYFDDEFGVCVEDIVIVIENGCE